MPEASETATAVAASMVACRAAEDAMARGPLRWRCGRVRRWRASAMPVNPRAKKPITFTMPAQLIRAAEAASSAQPERRLLSSRSMPRSPTSRPTSSRPIMMASLWMPPTMCSTVNGLRMPSHKAAGPVTPQRFASASTAQAAARMPAIDTARWASTPQKIESPVTYEITAAVPSATGPYGLGECAQINGTERARWCSTPSSSTGPEEYGSSPWRTMLPLAR